MVTRTKPAPNTFGLNYTTELTSATPLISYARARIFYKYANPNHGWITDEFAERLISTLPYTPVIGIYNEEAEDYTTHSRDPSEARIYGLVPEYPNGAWEEYTDTDGITRSYYCCDVYLYTGRFENAKQIIGSAQSLELHQPSIKGQWEQKNGSWYYVYTDAMFFGLSVLGEGTQPGFQGASFYEFASGLKEIVQEAVKNRENKQIGGHTPMENFRFSPNEKVEKIWRQVNPNFSADGKWTIDTVVANVTKDSVTTYDINLSQYAVRDYKVDSEGKLTFGDITVYEPVLPNTTAVLNYQKMTEELGSPSDALSKFSSLNEEITTLKSEINEKGQLIDTYQSEAQNQKEALEELQSKYSALNSQVEEAEKAEKEEVISSYSDKVSESAINEMREKMSKYTAQEIDMHLLYEWKKSAPDMFSSNGKVAAKAKVPSGKTPAEADPIKSLVDRYKN